jgi:molecular chaperone Hsp33
VDDQHVHWRGVRGGKALALEKCEPVPDRIITATASDGSFSLVAGITTSLVRETQSRHELSPTASAALGRLVTGAALLGASLKGKERLSLQVASDGPLRGMAADVSLLGGAAIGVRGYAREPHADLPLNARGKFDVSGLVGAGHLQVTRSFEIGQPYVGIVRLRTGEVGDDIAGYLADSEQIPSIVALGVLANPEGVKAAGGVIAQLMPGAADRTIEALESRAGMMPAITAQIEAGATPEDLARSIAGDLNLRSLGEYEVVFACRCTRERVEIALLALGRDELLKIAREQPHAEAVCEFCKKRYVLSREEVGELVTRFPARSPASGP